VWGETTASRTPYESAQRGEDEGVLDLVQGNAVLIKLNGQQAVLSDH
jgi:hypothetical protein